MKGEKKMQSQLLKINLADVGKALLIAFLTAFIGSIYVAFQAGHFPTLQELGQAAMAGISAALAYLIKNFFTNSQNQLLKPEPDNQNTK